MGCITAFVAAVKHLVTYAHGIANTKHLDAAVHELFANPINCHIAGGCNQDLILTLKGLDDGLDERGGLTSARRAVDDGHVTSLKNMLDSIGLTKVEPRAADLRKFTKARSQRAQQSFTETDKRIVVTTYGLLESTFHDLIGGGIDTKPQSEEVSTTAVENGLDGVLPNHTETQRARCHAVDIALMRKFVYRAIVFLIEKTDSLAWFELIVAEVVGHRATDSEYQVVEGVAMPLDRLNGVSSTRNEGILNLEFRILKGLLILMTFIVELTVDEFDETGEMSDGLR